MSVEGLGHELYCMMHGHESDMPCRLGAHTGSAHGAQPMAEAAAAVAALYLTDQRGERGKEVESARSAVQQSESLFHVHY